MQPAPGTGWRVKVVRPAYKPILSRVERAAYAAAHQILTIQNTHPELACAGTRRSRQADSIAKIIVESMER